MTSYNLRLPAIRGKQGSKLDVFHLQVTVAGLATVIGHDPRPENWKHLSKELRAMYEQVQRKTVPARRRELRAYLKQKLVKDSKAVGFIPPLTLLSWTPVQAKRVFPENPDRLEMVEAEFSIPLAGDTAPGRYVVDGLGRVCAYLDLWLKERDESVKDLLVPITVIAPREGLELSMDEISSLFVDVNFRSVPLSKDMAVKLDRDDLHVAMVHDLAKRPVFEDNGGVQQKGASLGKKSTALVVRTVLHRFVLNACEGGRVAEPLRVGQKIRDPKLTNDNYSELLRDIGDGLTIFADAMSVNKRFTDRSSTHLSAVGWNSLGRAFYDILQQPKERQPELFRALGNIDWSKNNASLMKAVAVLKDGEWQVRGSNQTYRSGHKYLLDAIGIKGHKEDDAAAAAE